MEEHKRIIGKPVNKFHIKAGLKEEYRDVTVPCGTHRCNNFQEFQRASLEDTQFE